MKKLIVLLIAILFFSCSSQTYKNYPSVKIGDQIWSSINLDVDVFRNGDTIPEAKNKEEWLRASKREESVWCYYKFDKKYQDFGKLYNYYAVSDSRKIAPSGWRVPTFYETSILVKTLDPTFILSPEAESIAGGFLKSTELGFDWKGEECSQYDSGFNALPSGAFSPSLDYPQYDWHSIFEHAYFWVLTDWNDILEIPGIFKNKEELNEVKQSVKAGDFKKSAITMRLFDYSCLVDWDDDPFINGYSVRLIKDK